jgi:hypothetical protein
VRPHFRHQSGSEEHRCHVLSARAALLASLQEGDMIVLPRLRRAVNVQGLSGTMYQGWIEVSPQAVRIGHIHFSDVTAAEVVLDDGRRLKVIVTGRAHSGDTSDAIGETLVPSIEIGIDDPFLATLSPEELRSRLVPAIEAGAWCGHWPDPASEATALEDAKQAAGLALDWDDQSLDLPPDLRRESLLHREVKAILAAADEVLLPGWFVSNSGKLVTEPHHRSRVRLAGARLEKKLGRIIPDVIAQLGSGGELLVEVTVTNTITAERTERIRAVNLPTVEIDFSRMAGMLSREMLRKLVLDEVAGKVWLHHPSAQWQNQQDLHLHLHLEGEARYFGLRKGKELIKSREQILATPADEWAEQYLAAVRELAKIDFEVDPDELLDAQQPREDARAAVLAAADALHVHGYPEALDHRLFDDQRTMLHRLMSIMMGHPVAYRYRQIWQVINSMLTDVTAEAKSWHGLYLLAVKAKAPDITPSQARRLEEWRSEVRGSVMRGEEVYRRDTRYDRLFALLFPELSVGLDNLRLKRRAAPKEPSLVGIQPDSVEDAFFKHPDPLSWNWAVTTAVRVRELEVAASRARLDGWSVDENSLVYHLLREARATSYVSTMARIVGEKVGVEDVVVLRYLCCNGYITQKPGME